MLRVDRTESHSHPYLPLPAPSIFNAPEWTYHARLPTPASATKFATIFSFYTSEEYEDLSFPVPQDWALQDFEGLNQQAAWSERIDCAIFRGSASGYGITESTNPRLALAALHNPDKGMDFRLTSWNRRLKFQPDGTVACIDPSKFDFEASRKHFMPMHEQRRYRYIVYVDGNVGASRLGALLCLGATVLVVTSSAPRVWLLQQQGAPVCAKPMVHFVPVQSVAEVPGMLQWCRENEKVCERIAEEGKRLGSRISEEAQRYAISMISR